MQTPSHESFRVTDNGGSAFVVSEARLANYTATLTAQVLKVRLRLCSICRKTENCMMLDTSKR